MTEPPPPAAAPAPLISWRRGLAWLVRLWLLGWLGMCLDRAVAHTDVGEGVMSGLLLGVFLAPLQLLFLVPLAAIGLLLGSWRPLRRWRRWLGLALPVAAILTSVVFGVKDRLEPGRRFERSTQVALPRDARNLKVYWSGGLLADITDTYTFDCPKAETERLIRELRLRRDEVLDPVRNRGLYGFDPLERGWKNPELWREPSPIGSPTPQRRFHFLKMYTDESHTRVHIIYGTT
jgi:hypothetical protein